jgi:hypothetical protein
LRVKLEVSDGDGRGQHHKVSLLASSICKHRCL